jgi:N-acetyl-1-D-myo-inositol-2-amino-2-deoxy-alpha-D-glucopyranoside deacetylase
VGHAAGCGSGNMASFDLLPKVAIVGCAEPAPVFAHPDDESLSACGLLARHATAGARTAVVTATWAPDTPRAGELAEALRILGTDEPRMLGYADARAPESAPGRQRFCDAPLDEAVRRLVAHIREFRPEIMVTHDAYGGVTGHPDHVHTHRVTVLAAQAAGLDQLYPDAAAEPEAQGLSTKGRSGGTVSRKIMRGQRMGIRCPRAETGRGGGTWTQQCGGVWVGSSSQGLWSC